MRNNSPVRSDEAFERLLRELGLPVPTGTIRISGADPVIASPHRLGEATATALAAQGAAAAALWQLRGGYGQDVSIDVRHALAALDTNRFMKLNNHSIQRSRVLPKEPLNGAFRTADDRWLVFQATYPHHRNGLLELLDASNTQSAIATAAAGWNASELEEACAERRLPCAMVRSYEEWLAHPQGAALSQTPLATIEQIAPGDPQPLEPSTRPAQGIRVIDATHVIAGPGLSRTLAEHGADVLHVVAPDRIDPWPIAMDTGMGKRSAFVDLNDDADLTRLGSLIETADVFVQSFSPGCFERRGLSPLEVSRKRPGIVYVSISCYGADAGPWSGRRGFDPQAQAATGIMMAEGRDGQPRTVPTQLLNDFLTAYVGAAATLAALVRRATYGGSYHVKLSLARTSMWVREFGLLDKAAITGKPAALSTEGFATSRMDTPFGCLEYLPPVTKLSRTPAYWDKPPCPPGSSEPSWI